MQKYSDSQNASGMKVIFMLLQMGILLVVYTIVYTSFVAVKLAIEEYGASNATYIPVVLALILFPVLLYKYRKMFNAGRMLRATVWTMASASLFIVLLYVYIAEITG